MEVNRIFIKGDCHGSFSFLRKFCLNAETTRNDLLVILGDAGINYFLDSNDSSLKDTIKSLPITLLCVHGNHEERPFNINTYTEKSMFGGIVYMEEEYDNILFAKDGENYSINGRNFFVLGGAYSIDKYHRLANGYKWFASEQPNEEIKKYVANQIKAYNKTFDIVLSHTAPLKYEPTEMFLSMVDQSLVDKSTEIWLDEIEDKISYNMWYFGHYHGDKFKAPKVRMVFNDIIEIKPRP